MTMTAAMLLAFALSASAAPTTKVVYLNDHEVEIIRIKDTKKGKNSHRHTVSTPPKKIDIFFAYLTVLTKGTAEQQKATFCRARITTVVCTGMNEFAATGRTEDKYYEDDVLTLSEYGRMMSGCWSGSKRDRKEFLVEGEKILQSYREWPTKFGCSATIMVQRLRHK